MTRPRRCRHVRRSNRTSVVAWVLAGSSLLAAESGEEPAPRAPEHWAYVAPRTPDAFRELGVRAGIDRLVDRAIDRAGLRANAPASRETLLRRLSLDLVGLPPDPAALDAFLADEEPEAIPKRIDLLLASPGFGERWARPWLDLARYADSNGFQADQLRESWAYRDWVIDALQGDLPFDQFTIEQIAGDLLPDADLDSRIATGFHRSVVCNVEAGVHPEENRTQQVVDRVNTTATVWLGTTLECAQCHDHKYDPFTTREYYQLFAYFNSTEIEVANPRGKGVQFDFVGPTMELPLSERDAAERERLEARIAELEDARLAAASSAPGSAADPTALEDELAAARAALTALRPSTTLILVEREEARVTRVLRRGEYLDPGEEVAPGTPDRLHPLSVRSPPDRLGLARWLVAPENPLVARVTVNRWWAELFGRGIVATLEDFGTRSDPPTHPEILDGLAVDFVESGWSMKRTLRHLVSTRVYQRASAVPFELEVADPENRLLARASRLRLPAESVRDVVLAASGLLSRAKGGPPVMPPQPDGIWRHVGRNAPKWAIEKDERRHRRGVYVVWRRSAPYPAFVTFDAPDRSSCVVSRSRTNTPLQALAMLNDPVLHEASIALAARVLHESSAPADSARIDLAYRLVLSRDPSEDERRLLLDFVSARRARFIARPALAGSLLKIAAPVASDLAALSSNERLELASWTLLASVLLNTDEAITRE